MVMIGKSDDAADELSVVIKMQMLMVDPKNASSGGRDGAGVEKQTKPRGDVSRHVELANQEPSGLLWQTMTVDRFY